MLTKEKILDIADKKGKIKTKDIVEQFDVSRQYASGIISELVDEGKLFKVGKTRGSFYVSRDYLQKNPQEVPNHYSETFINKDLEEHRVLEKIKSSFSKLNNLPENVGSIFTYAFSEMFNNAIEHSKSNKISVEIGIQDDTLSFQVRDYGIGVFRNVMQKRGLKNELEAIQDLLKGKITTMPKSHSGEGIFFTSKSGDIFGLESFGYSLIVDNKLPDVFVQSTDESLEGTKVKFQIDVESNKHLNDVFKKFTDKGKGGNHGFDKTEVHVKLYTVGGVYISRSQARRILSGLDKFKVILLDYDKVPVVGQAFADEIYRVFQNKHPDIKIESINMKEGVRFMVERAKKEAGKEKQS